MAESFFSWHMQSCISYRIIDITSYATRSIYPSSSSLESSFMTRDLGSVCFTMSISPRSFFTPTDALRPESLAASFARSSLVKASDCFRMLIKCVPVLRLATCNTSVKAGNISIWSNTFRQMSCQNNIEKLTQNIERFFCSDCSLYIVNNKVLATDPGKSLRFCYSSFIDWTFWSPMNQLFSGKLAAVDADVFRNIFLGNSDS